MAKTDSVGSLGDLLKGKKPKGGSSSNSKAQVQDIELNPKSTPAGGKGPSVGSQAVPLNKQIDALLTKNGVLIDKSPEAVQKLTQIIGRWEVNETTRLSDLGGKETQKRILKYLKNSGNQEMYVSALAKHDPSNGKMPAREFQDDYNEFVQQPVPRQERAPLESTGNSPTSRPDNRTGRGGKNSDTVSTQERVSEATAKILDGKGTDEDFDFVLKQGLGWNEKKQNGAFLDEFQAAASTQDVNKRAEIIERMSQNASAVGNNSKQAQPFLQRRFSEYIERQLPLYEAAKPSGGGAKVVDEPLDFDGGGAAKNEGPEIELGGKENSDTFETKPEASQGGGGKDTPPPDAKTATGAPDEKPPFDTRDQIEIPPGYKGPTPGKGGSVEGMPSSGSKNHTTGKTLQDQLESSRDYNVGETKARADYTQSQKDVPKSKRNQRRGMAAGAAGVATGGIAWAWLAGGDDEPEGPVSPAMASITGDPSTSTGPAGGAVADGSGSSSGGMSQEQMENLMKLQQIRDEQKRRHVGFGNTHSGVSR